MERCMAPLDTVFTLGLGMGFAFVGAVVLTPVSIRLARAAGVIDYPQARRVHRKPTPRWGGLAMCASFIIAICLITFFVPGFIDRRIAGVLVSGILMTTLGALDDKYALPAKRKLLGQILCASVLVLPCFGVRMEMAWNSMLSPVVGMIATVAWVVLVTNTINLIDGLDGLAAGIACITSLTFVVISAAIRGSLSEALLASAVVGVCLGLLCYNFYPAKVFIGDAGSHFLGVIIAVLSILQGVKITTGIALLVPILTLAVPLADTAFAIIRRLYHRQPIFSSDKGHLHHRLLQLGWNQTQVVLTIYFLTLLGCYLAFLVARACMQ